MIYKSEVAAYVGVMETIQAIAQWVGGIVLGGGTLALVVFGAFKFLAAKWLEAKFGERLEAFKHQQAKEIERIRFKINSLLDRATKLHQREFEVLPQAWALLVESFHRTQGLVAPLQQYPELNAMNSQQLGEFLGRTRLDDWEKNELVQQQDKTAYYAKHIFWHEYNEVNAAVRDAHVFLLKHGIFIESAIRTRLRSLDDLIWNALHEREVGERHGPPKETIHAEALRKTGPVMIDELESMIQDRLWDKQEAL